MKMKVKLDFIFNYSNTLVGSHIYGLLRSRPNIIRNETMQLISLKNNDKIVVKLN